jgi:hypothetical protein
MWKRGSADENVWELRKINENLTSSMMKIETVLSVKTLIQMCYSTRCHVPEYHTLNKILNLMREVMQ